MSPQSLIPCVLIVGSLLCHSQEVSTAKWQILLKSDKLDTARTLCTEWTKSADSLTEAEGHKCMASVVLYGQEGIEIAGNDVGGGTLGPGFPPEVVDAALMHLNQALKLSPQDLSIHQGRLYMLEISGRISQMANALDESCQIYKGPGAFEAWLGYSSELADNKQFKAALEITKVLERYFPDSHEVIGNIGSIYNMQGKPVEGLPYLEKAVALAPDDPFDNWNLARAYDFLDKVGEADAQYQKAMKLKFNAEQTRTNECFYAEFVENKLKDQKRACELEKQSCEPDKQTACKGQP